MLRTMPIPLGTVPIEHGDGSANSEFPSVSVAEVELGEERIPYRWILLGNGPALHSGGTNRKSLVLVVRDLFLFLGLIQVFAPALHLYLSYQQGGPDFLTSIFDLRCSNLQSSIERVSPALAQYILSSVVTGCLHQQVVCY